MSPKAKTQPNTEHHIKECVGCKQTFSTTFADAKICGQYICWARTTFTDERWEAQLRMAEARLDAGVPLGPLDFDAYERAGKEVSW